MPPGPQRHVSIDRGLGPEGRVAVVRLDRGDKLNALSPAVMRELRSAAIAFEDDLATSVVLPEALAFAARIAAMPPLPVSMTKISINRLAGALDELAAHMDGDQFALAGSTEDHAEGVAAFLARRKPRFRGR